MTVTSGINTAPGISISMAPDSILLAVISAIWVSMITDVSTLRTVASNRRLRGVAENDLILTSAFVTWSAFATLAMKAVFLVSLNCETVVSSCTTKSSVDKQLSHFSHPGLSRIWVYPRMHMHCSNVRIPCGPDEPNGHDAQNPLPVNALNVPGMQAEHSDPSSLDSCCRRHVQSDFDELQSSENVPCGHLLQPPLPELYVLAVHVEHLSMLSVPGFEDDPTGHALHDSFPSKS